MFRENSRRSACSETSIAFLPYGLRFWGRQFETYASPGAVWDLPLDTPAARNLNTLGPMSEAVASVSAVALIWRSSSRAHASVKWCPFLAQMRSADRVRKCLLFGIDRTYRRHVLNDANDPQRTSSRSKALRACHLFLITDA